MVGDRTRGSQKKYGERSEILCAEKEDAAAENGGANI
jgi:hypothetical protein